MEAQKDAKIGMVRRADGTLVFRKLVSSVFLNLRTLRQKPGGLGGGMW